MKPETSLQEEANKLMKIKGMARGETLRTHAVYIYSKMGERGIKSVEEKMEELGYPIKFQEVKPLEWYPEALGILIILVAKEIFHWENEDIFNILEIIVLSHFSKMCCNVKFSLYFGILNSCSDSNDRPLRYSEST